MMSKIDWSIDRFHNLYRVCMLCDFEDRSKYMKVTRLVGLSCFVDEVRWALVIAGSTWCYSELHSAIFRRDHLEGAPESRSPTCYTQRTGFSPLSSLSAPLSLSLSLICALPLSILSHVPVVFVFELCNASPRPFEKQSRNLTARLRRRGDRFELRHMIDRTIYRCEISWSSKSYQVMDDCLLSWYFMVLWILKYWYDQFYYLLIPIKLYYMYVTSVRIRVFYL